jgi:hypothetical protein
LYGIGNNLRIKNLLQGPHRTIILNRRLGRLLPVHLLPLLPGRRRLCLRCTYLQHQL